MMKKLILTIALSISMFVAPLPLHARGGGKGGDFGRFGQGAVGGGKRFGSRGLIGSWVSSPGYLSPVYKSHGVVSIMVNSQDVEIYLNGKFIGRSKDFKGPALLSVPAGKYILDFRHNGSVVQSQELNIIPGSTTFIVKDRSEIEAKSQ